MQTLLPMGALALISVVWGYSWILNKLALSYTGPFTFAAYRMTIAAICLLLAMVVLKRPLKPHRWPELLRLGLIQTTGFVGISMWALVEGTIGPTAVLVFTMPFWTVAFAWPLLNEKIEGSQWAALALALAGLTAIVQPWHIQGAILSKCLAIAAGIAWAVSSVEVKRMQRRGSIDLLSLTTWQMVFGTAPLWLLALVVHEPAPHWAPRFVLILLALAIIATALCWFLWLYALRHLPTGVASMGMLTIPVVALLSAQWHFGEQTTPPEILGFLLIGSALLLLSYRAFRLHGDVAPIVGQE